LFTNVKEIKKHFLNKDKIDKERTNESNNNSQPPMLQTCHINLIMYLYIWTLPHQ